MATPFERMMVAFRIFGPDIAHGAENICWNKFQKQVDWVWGDLNKYEQLIYLREAVIERGMNEVWFFNKCEQYLQALVDQK